MKYYRTMTVCAAGWLAWCIVAHADDPTPAKNPYANIASRNAFGLVAIQQAPPVLPPARPLPRIVPKGYETILGPDIVLFEVIETASDRPAGKSWHALREGEAEDDIAVLCIESATGTVTFNNHGTVQKIPILDASGIGTGARP